VHYLLPVQCGYVSRPRSANLAGLSVFRLSILCLWHRLSSLLLYTSVKSAKLLQACHVCTGWPLNWKTWKKLWNLKAVRENGKVWENVFLVELWWFSLNRNNDFTRAECLYNRSSWKWCIFISNAVGSVDTAQAVWNSRKLDGDWILATLLLLSSSWEKTERLCAVV